MEDEVLLFIRKRFPKDNDWCNGNCYWFSRILNLRFPKYPIWLFPIENHFMIGDGTKFYDWRGIRLLKDCEEQPIKWEDVKLLDESYYGRLVRDCVM